MQARGLFRGLGVLAVLLASGALGAEARGVIFGTVKDAGSGQPVADVVITATSPSMPGEQTVVSDAQGAYRIPGLPPGTYTVRFEKEHFRPYPRADVPLRDGHATRLEVSILPEVYDEYYVSWGCGPPAVDVGSTTTGRELHHELEFYRVLGRSSGPLGAVRGGEDLAPFVPGVLDAAGVLSISGASVFENEYVLDGLSVRDAVLGLDALPLSMELMQAPDLAAGGYPAEYGRATGGRLWTVTPSGSNALHGSIFGFWTPGLLEGRRASTEVASQDALKHQGDFGATLGGPVLKDRLWFFVGVTPALSRVERTRTVEAPDAGVATSRSFDDARSLQALGKLTYLFDMNHNVSLSLLTAPSSLEAGSTGSAMSALHYSGAFMDKRLLVDVNTGWLSQRVTPRAGESGDRTVDRYQAHARVMGLARWLGMHEFKAGVDAEWLTYARTGSRTPSTVFGGYVQDSVSFVNRITLNVGARYDVQRIDEARGGHVTSARLSPRVGLVVAPHANGRAKVFAHYGKLTGLTPLGLTDAPAPGTDVTLDPDLALMSSSEVVTGLEYELFDDVVLGGTYTHRGLENGVARVPRAEGNSFVLANPGSGLAADSPRAARHYDAVTVELRRTFLAGWQGQVSYTWSKLTGNYESPFAAWDGLALERRLPLDRPHVLRAYGARQFFFGNQLTADVGASYLGASGVLLKDTGERTPWMQSLDVYLGVGYRPTPHQDPLVTFRLDVFNVFNAQEVAQAETHDAVDGASPVTVRYQAPRQVRLGARYEF